MQDKKYPFLDFDAPRILEDFLKLIKLPKIKCPKEVRRIDDKKKYYKYHRLVSHLIEQCFVLKDKILCKIDSTRKD